MSSIGADDGARLEFERRLAPADQAGNSVSTRTNIQLRISALQTRAVTEMIFNGSSPGVVNVIHILRNVLCQ